MAELNYEYISQEMCQIKMDQDDQTVRVKWASQTGSHKCDWKGLVSSFLDSVVFAIDVYSDKSTPHILKDICMYTLNIIHFNKEKT